MACQDQVCFCPFKAKKPGGTFPKEREGWMQAEEEGGTIGSSRNERKRKFTHNVHVLKDLCCIDFLYVVI